MNPVLHEYKSKRYDLVGAFGLGPLEHRILGMNCARVVDGCARVCVLSFIGTKPLADHQAKEPSQV